MLKDVRARAALSIAKVISGSGAFSGEVGDFQSLDSESDERDLKDKAFYRELCFGTLRHFHRLSAEVSQLLRKPLAKKDNDIYAVLLTGIYQISHLRTPDHAAISASVDAAKSLKKPWAKGLINAVLRNYLRQNENSRKRFKLTEAAHHAHPEWLFKRLKNDWPEHWEQIIAANNHYPPMSLRINSTHCDRNQYAALLEEKGIECSISEICNSSITLKKACDISSLPNFELGWLSVQDLGAQFAGPLLCADNTMSVLDACAAPGGKTLHTLELAPHCKLTALDNDETRLQRVAENIDRGKSQAKLIYADASKPDQWWDKKRFDRILLDAPCSATGVISHHPDIKLLRRPSDIESFVTQQQKLITQLWPLLKPGGQLLYATCSVMAEENELLVDWFLHKTNDAEVIPINAEWGIERGAGRQLLPKPSENGGFFYAVLSKLVKV